MGFDKHDASAHSHGTVEEPKKTTNFNSSRMSRERRQSQVQFKQNNQNAVGKRDDL